MAETTAADPRSFASILTKDLFTKWYPVADATMYVAIKGLDNKTAVKFEEMGGYAIAGTIGRVLVDYLEANESLGTMSPETTIALKCLTKPIVSAILAALGSMAIPKAYSGRSPFYIFKEGVVIYLLADGVAVKFMQATNYMAG